MHTDEELNPHDQCASVPHLWLFRFDQALSAFSRFASQSRGSPSAWPSRVVSILPLIVSPSSFPLYLETIFIPLRSRVVVKASTPSLKLASSILVSVLFCPEITTPAGFPSSVLSFMVCSRVLLLKLPVHFQVPSYGAF